jgi:hypothetical protein
MFYYFEYILLFALVKREFVNATLKQRMIPRPHLWKRAGYSHLVALSNDTP